MNLNNLYNFKNPVKNFLNIDNLDYPENVQNFPVGKLVWTEPIKFRVRKQDDKYRTLRFPNILNFVCAYEAYKNMPNFDNIQEMDSEHKRLSANIETGDFTSGEYDRQLELDFNELCIYDNLIKLDVKEYYGRIYTHNINFCGHEERYLSNMNTGATNGLLMGNYLSLYFAEKILSEISNDIEKALSIEHVNYKFTYFSDDFYFFCNQNDNDKVIYIFDKILEKYDLERSDKKEIWTYETFNNYNMIARYWKKVVADCNRKFKGDHNDNKLYFINQIVYRMSKLKDQKSKKIFINNMFKIKYFRELPLEKYLVKEYDYHQLCYIMKYSPESMIYLANRFSEMNNFNNQELHRFFSVRFEEILKKSFNEEQLYYYYAIKIFGFADIISQQKDLVVRSNNQILISYYLKDGLFDVNNLNYLKDLTDEGYWFQNYHLVLYCQELFMDLENNIEKYLIPKIVSEAACNNNNKREKRNSYLLFYANNIRSKKAIIRDIVDVKQEIIQYLNLKIAESESKFAEDDEIEE